MTADLDVLFVAPERFHMTPQVGVPCVMSWPELGAYLSRPSVGDAKDIAGAWSPALYHGNVRRKANLVRIGALVVDLDENGDVDTATDLVAKYSAIVHETFSSTNDAPRCRVVLLLAEPVAAAAYEALHKVVRARLGAAGMPADEGAKDASRLSYAPVRRPGAGYRFRTVEGTPLDARAILAAQPAKPPPRPAPPPPPEHADAYRRAALRRAADAVSAATPGERHYVLCKEAFALARLGLHDFEIENALQPAAVAAMGEGRAHEAARTIRDGIRARRGAP